MITRGLQIGKIIDDLASLKYQLEMRNKLNLTDLSRFSEDFIKEVLNCVYSLALSNLNSQRTNVPGIDLGDETQKIAYQITTQKTTAKISETLTKISEEQYSKFSDIRVFILGEKQSKYSIDQELMASRGFTERKIFDIDDLVRDIAVLDLTVLDAVYSIFTRDFRSFKIELEPLDATGSFESSIFNRLEVMPNAPPRNSKGFLKYADDDEIKHKHIRDIYLNLSKTPRASREIIALIYERGTHSSRSYPSCSIYRLALARYMKQTLEDTEFEMQMLNESKLVYQEFIEKDDAPNIPIYEIESKLCMILDYLKEKGHSIRAAMNSLDFRVLDEE